jgi:endonuclease/exonuclease/phosphatase (EEP) superfamily protein YafD
VLLVKATVQDAATSDELKEMWREFASWIEAQEPSTWAYQLSQVSHHACMNMRVVCIIG